MSYRVVQHLPDDDVGVVAARRDHGGVRIREAGAFEHRDVHAVSDDEATGPRTQSSERILVLVDHGDVPPVGDETSRDRGSDAPAPDHHGVHGCAAYSSNVPSGNATTRTSQGALRRTKSTVGEKNRD